MIYLYFYSENGLLLLDVTNKASPSTLYTSATIYTQMPFSSTSTNFLYLSHYQSLPGMYKYKITTPSAPVLVDFFESITTANPTQFQILNNNAMYIGSAGATTGRIYLVQSGSTMYPILNLTYDSAFVGSNKDKNVVIFKGQDSGHRNPKIITCIGSRGLGTSRQLSDLCKCPTGTTDVLPLATECQSNCASNEYYDGTACQTCFHGCQACVTQTLCKYCKTSTAVRVLPTCACPT